MDGNYVKLSRKILDWEWFDDINTFRLFMYMLLKANWKDAIYKGTTVPRGSFISSLSKLAEKTGLTLMEIRTAIAHLKTTGEVTVTAHTKYSVFTVNNYILYQEGNTQDDTQTTGDTTNEQQTSNKLLTTIEERKKERRKEEKNIKKKDTKVSLENLEKNYFPNNELLDKALKEYIAYRSEIKKPMTNRAIDLIITKLSAYDNATAIAMLHQSIENGWQGIFPLKAEGSSNKGNESAQARNKFNDFPQRNYTSADFGNLEQQILQRQQQNSG